MKKLEHLSEIYEPYDTFIIDLWGVMHNGISLNDKAIKVIENLSLNKKRIVFLSNAPRPSSDVAKFLKELNLNEKFLNNIITSGEAAIESLKKNEFGKKFFHIGPERDKTLFKNLEANKTNFKEADFILCTGLFEENENLDYYRNLFEKDNSKKLVCTNPDLTVHRGNQEEFCAGKIAEIYETLGGEVIYFGKPYKEIYKLILKNGEKNLIIGDNLNTDIKGANNLNLDSIFITSGVHRSELVKNRISYLLEKYKVTIKFFQKELCWWNAYI